MTAIALALSLAAALPEGTARFRFELAGEAVGAVELSISCAAEGCAAIFASERRAPAEAGGARSWRRIEVEVDRAGRFAGGALRLVEDGAARAAIGRPGAVPASLAEVVLAGALSAPERPGAAPGEERCVEVFDEASGEQGRACARREGEEVLVRVLGIAETVAPGADGFPLVVSIPAHGARFLRDPAAALPRAPPRLHGTAVPGAADPARARAFCGVARDAQRAPSGGRGLPPPRAEGASCREKTAAWLARAAARGHRGRTAVGVAWDGRRFVWHAWAEVRAGEGWLPVDPSFGELPARGPRFTLATWEEGDEAGRRRAGERILACWGRAAVSAGPP